MVYFLTKYYDKVYLYIIYEGKNYKICDYYKFLFENCEYHGNDVIYANNVTIVSKTKDLVEFVKQMFMQRMQ
jgi:hypothetical protein